MANSWYFLWAIFNKRQHQPKKQRNIYIIGQGQASLLQHYSTTIAPYASPSSCKSTQCFIKVTSPSRLTNAIFYAELFLQSWCSDSSLKSSLPPRIQSMNSGQPQEEKAVKKGAKCFTSSIFQYAYYRIVHRLPHLKAVKNVLLLQRLNPGLLYPSQLDL